MRRVPDFDLPGQDGRRHSLADFAERVLSLCFVPVLGTPACDQLLRGLADRTADFAALDGTLACVAAAPASEVDATARRLELPFALLADATGATAAAFGLVPARTPLYGGDGLGGLPQSFVIDPGPRLRFHVHGANVRLHPQLLLTALARPAAHRAARPQSAAAPTG